jgi:hypothetical protein
MVYTQEADQAAEFCFPDQLARIYIYYLSPKSISFRDITATKRTGASHLKYRWLDFCRLISGTGAIKGFFGMTKKVSCSRMQDVFTGRLCPK